MGNTNFTQTNEADLDWNRQIGIQELQGPLSQVNCQLGVGKFTRWADVVANSVVRPEEQADKELTQSQIQIEDRVSDTENLNVFQTSIGPLADKDQASRVLDSEVGRTSPIGSVSWAEAVDLANIAPFLSQNNVDNPSFLSEEEVGDSIEDFIPGFLGEKTQPLLITTKVAGVDFKFDLERCGHSSRVKGLSLVWSRSGNQLSIVNWL
ncbi:hypothetical protein V6N13_009455 [Hibiscus sabdariffa]